jgi:hypothetical protein
LKNLKGSKKQVSMWHGVVQRYNNTKVEEKELIPVQVIVDVFSNAISQSPFCATTNYLEYSLSLATHNWFGQASP